MRLVDADMLIKTIPTEEINARMAIATAPTIEAEPIKHGRWIDCGTAIEGDTEVKCSECGEVLYWLANYCPNCGAKMDESTMGQRNPDEPINHHIENDGTYAAGEEEPDVQ